MHVTDLPLSPNASLPTDAVLIPRPWSVIDVSGRRRVACLVDETKEAAHWAGRVWCGRTIRRLLAASVTIGATCHAELCRPVTPVPGANERPTAERARPVR